VVSTFTKGALATIAQGDSRGCNGSAIILTPGGPMSFTCHSQFLSGPGALRYLGSRGGVPTYELAGAGSTTITLFRGSEGVTIASDRVTISVGFALAWTGGGGQTATGAAFRIVPSRYFK
jgi:hypothetical protein